MGSPWAKFNFLPRIGPGGGEPCLSQLLHESRSTTFVLANNDIWDAMNEMRCSPTLLPSSAHIYGSRHSKIQYLNETHIVGSCSN